jgi:hypothetical protein
MDDGLRYIREPLGLSVSVSVSVSVSEPRACQVLCGWITASVLRKYVPVRVPVRVQPILPVLARALNYFSICLVRFSIPRGMPRVYASLSPPSLLFSFATSSLSPPDSFPPALNPRQVWRTVRSIQLLLMMVAVSPNQRRSTSHKQSASRARPRIQHPLEPVVSRSPRPFSDSFVAFWGPRARST